MRTGWDVLAWCHVLPKFLESPGANQSDHEKDDRKKESLQREENWSKPESDGVSSGVTIFAGKIKLFLPPMKMGVSEPSSLL